MKILTWRLSHADIIDITAKKWGFVKNCGTVDAIFAVRRLFEKHPKKKDSLHLAFFDMEKAFHRVPHDLIWLSLTMRDHNVPEEYIRWGNSYNKIPRAEFAGVVSLSFRISVDVHQNKGRLYHRFSLCYAWTQSHVAFRRHSVDVVVCG